MLLQHLSAIRNARRERGSESRLAWNLFIPRGVRKKERETSLHVHCICFDPNKPVLFQRLILTSKPITGDEGLEFSQLHLKTVHLAK